MVELLSVDYNARRPGSNPGGQSLVMEFINIYHIQVYHVIINNCVFDCSFGLC